MEDLNYKKEERNNNQKKREGFPNFVHMLGYVYEKV